MMMTLPTPRALLTTIFKSLPSTPTSISPTQDQPQIVIPPYDPPSNPLKKLSGPHRALFTTLHVLLPTGILLQALDLLDRGLVVRVVEESITPEAERVEVGDERRVMPPQTNAHLSDSSTTTQSLGQHQDGAHGHRRSVEESGRVLSNGRKKRNTIYQVRSSQASKFRFRDPLSTSSSLVYTVRIEAWNCNCAAFAFEAFPGRSLRKAPWLVLDDDGNDRGEHMHAFGDESKAAEGGADGGQSLGEGGTQWEFGGLSCDGSVEGRVPVCKHLLACVLAERWEDVLGSFVKERGMSIEEMAGVGGEG